MNGDASPASMPDAEPAAWNADARSRAQTRALLMALSRDRAAYFIGRAAVSLTLAIATCGILPLVRRSRRFRSIERMEWSELLEASSWLPSFTRLGTAAETLQNLARHRLATVRSRRSRLVAFFTFQSLLVLLVTVEMSLMPTGSTEPLWRGLFLCIAFAWILQLLLVTTHQVRLREWIKAINQALASDEKRPVHQPRPLWPAFYCLGIPLVIVQGLTALPVVLLLVVLTRLIIASHLREFRQTRLHLMERLLEYMDDTGLPVEYDVVALNPDEIAAMIA